MLIARSFSSAVASGERAAWCVRADDLVSRVRETKWVVLNKFVVSKEYLCLLFQKEAM